MTSVPPPNWQPSSTPDPEPAARPASAGRVRPKLTLGLVAAAVLAGGAFALFGSTASKLTDPIAQAETVSSSAAGYRMHMAMDFSSPAVPSATGVGDGSVDLRDHTATASVTLNLGSNPAATQALGSGTLRMNEILDGSTIYMKLPAAAMPGVEAGGKPWVKFDLASVGHLPGLSSLGSNPATSDPSQVLQALRSVSSGVVSEGQQRVDGLETTLYHADLNLDQIAKDLPAAAQAVAQGELEQGLGTRTLPIDVWIDAGHLVRRIRMTLDTALPGGQSVHFGLTADLSDYGPQPRPVIPPADQVRDVGALAPAR